MSSPRAWAILHICIVRPGIMDITDTSVDIHEYNDPWKSRYDVGASAGELFETQETDLDNEDDEENVDSEISHEGLSVVFKVRKHSQWPPGTSDEHTSDVTKSTTLRHSKPQ